MKKNWFFKKFNGIDKSLLRSIKKKKRHKVSKSRMKKGVLY